MTTWTVVWTADRNVACFYVGEEKVGTDVGFRGFIGRNLDGEWVGEDHKGHILRKGRKSSYEAALELLGHGAAEATQSPASIAA